MPLMPAGDISVGYYLYKSMKLFKGLITHHPSYRIDLNVLYGSSRRMVEQ